MDFSKFRALIFFMCYLLAGEIHLLPDPRAKSPLTHHGKDSDKGTSEVGLENSHSLCLPL